MTIDGIVITSWLGASLARWVTGGGGKAKKRSLFLSELAMYLGTYLFGNQEITKVIPMKFIIR